MLRSLFPRQFWLTFWISNCIGGAPASNLTNPFLITPLDQSGGGTQFLVFHGNLRTNYSKSRQRCISLGGDLAEVDSLPLLTHLTSQLYDPAFVNSFLGEQYNCAAVYPGSAVAIPIKGCDAILDSICEVPIQRDGLEKALERIATVTEKIDGVTTVTTVITGPITTNPALPCCKCCG